MYNRRECLKFGINVVTGVGAGLSTVAIVFAFQGSLRSAWLLMGLALLIDWVDGSLVRFFGLEGVLTRYDGRQLDAFADYLTYVIAPICAAWASGVLPQTTLGLVTGAFVCVVSSLQFARDDSKTKRAFLGFPSYWNFLYFYGWGLGMAGEHQMWMIAMSWFFGFATLIPIPFPYPSRFPVQKIILTLLGTIWGVLVLGFLLVPSVPEVYLAASLVFPLYYLMLPLFYYRELLGSVAEDQS